MIKLIWLLTLLLMLVSSGCNNPSGGSVVQINHTPLLKSPGGFTFSQIVAANGNINLQWQPSERASEYKVFIGTTSTDITTPVTTCTFATRSCAITGLDPTTLYYINVNSINAAGTKAVTTIGTALSVGSFDITSSIVADGQLNLTWSASDLATSYNVIYGTSSGSYSGVRTNVTSPFALTGLNNGVTYYARVVASNNNNGYVLSDSENNGTPLGSPSTPTGLNLSALSGQIDLNWTDIPGATSYKIYRGTTTGALSELSAGIGTSHYSDTTITDGTTYFYAVKAWNGYDSALSSEASARSISAFNMSSLAVGPGAMQVTVSWPATVGANSYDVMYGTNQLSLNLTAANVTSPFTLSGLTGGATYYFKVMAKNSIGLGTSLVSMNQLSATPIAAVAAPTGLTANATPGQIALDWTSVSGASSYEVLRGTSTGSYTSLQAGIVGSSYTDSTAVNGTPYYYVVRSFNGLSSGNSLEVSVQAINSFSLTAATSASATSINLSWGAATGADTFDVRYGTSSGVYLGTVSAVTSPYTLSGLTSGTTYFISIQAKNAIGLGTVLNSNELNAKTAVGAPTGLAAVATPSNVALSWSAVSGATNYNVYRRVTSGSYSQIASAVSATSYVDSPVSNGTTYFYMVRTFNGIESADSSEVSTQPIAAPVISDVYGNTDTSIRVTWSAATGATVYDIRYGTTSGTYTGTVTGVISPYSITGLTTGETYYVQIVAKNTIGGGTSVNSAESSGAPNSAPVLSSITAQAMESDTALGVAFTLSDNNHILSCAGSMSGSSSDATVIQNSGIVFSGTLPNCTATLTPEAGQTGTSTITLTATDGITPVTSIFNLTVNPCTVASIVWETQPTGMAAGNIFATAPRVSLRKADNSLCTTNVTPVTLEVSFDPSVQSDAAITGTDSADPSGGYALFSGARMQRAGTGFKLLATQNAATSVDSSAFNVTALAATTVLFTVQPQTVDQLATMLPSPVVRTADVYGNYVGVNAVPITISLQDNGEGATFGGTKTRNTNTSGISTFSGLTVSSYGNYYLRATTTSYGSVNSNTFNVDLLIPQNTVSVVEMLLSPIAHVSGNTNYARASVTMGRDFIDGTTTYNWNVVATNTSATTASTIRLRVNTTNAAFVTVPANTTVPTVYSATIPNGSITTTNTWTLRVESGSAKIFSSRLHVKQIGAYKAQALIPLSSITNSSTTGLVTATNTTNAASSNAMSFPPFSFVKSKFSKIDTAILFFTAKVAGGGNVCGALYNKTTGIIIGTERCIKNIAETYTTHTITPSTLPASADIEFRVRVSTGGATASIYKAGLLIRLVGIEDIVSIQRVAGAEAALTASTDLVQQRAFSSATDYGAGTLSEYIRCNAKANTNGSGSFIFNDHGTNTSGVAGATTISASTNIFSLQSAFTTLQAGPIATTNGNNMFMNYTHSSGSFGLSHCLLESEVSY